MTFQTRFRKYLSLKIHIKNCQSVEQGSWFIGGHQYRFHYCRELASKDPEKLTEFKAIWLYHGIQNSPCWNCWTQQVQTSPINKYTLNKQTNKKTLFFFFFSVCKMPVEGSLNKQQSKDWSGHVGQIKF